MKKVCIVGIDGGTLDIVEPLARSGDLPNIKRLMVEGVYGDLESTMPPITAPAWVSFITGKNPGKHGCYEFLLPAGTLGKTELISSRDIPSETLYEIIDHQHLRCIVINLPVSYPPRIEEIMVTSWMTLGKDFVFPKKLAQEIPEFKNYRLLPETSLRDEGKIGEYIRDVRRQEKVRFECARKLFKRNWDFFFVLFEGTDRVQHVKYGEMVDFISHRKSATLNGASGQAKMEWLELFKDLDGYIGWFARNIDRSDDMFLVSDHGFHSYKGLFFLHKWLRTEGYLCVKAKTEDMQGRRQKVRGVTGPRMKLATTLRTRPFFLVLMYAVARVLPWKYETRIAKFLETICFYMSTNLTVDLTKTVAFATSNRLFGIYINDCKRFRDGVVKDSEYESLRNEIMSKLKNLVEPTTNKPLFRKVFKKEEVYFGGRFASAPDILFELNDYWIKRYYEAPTIFLEKSHNHHSRKGLFVAHGQNIKKESKINGAKIVDIAPTVLHTMGIPVPADIDGRVLTEIFRDNLKPRSK